MSEAPVIITREVIRRYHLKRWARVGLSLIGAVGIFVMLFLCGCVIGGLFFGMRNFTWPVVLIGVVFAVGMFVWGWWYSAKHGAQDWEKLARRPERKAGVKLGRLSGQEYGQIGKGLVGLVLAGPEWVRMVIDEFGERIEATDERARRLEEVRRHLDAREGWVPLKHFESYEEEMWELAKMGFLSIRESSGEMFCHVTVEGTVMRSYAGDEDI